MRQKNAVTRKRALATSLTTVAVGLLFAGDALAADVTPPVFGSAPADVTTPATSATGATVSYTLPAATDPDDAVMSVGCVPASGTAFPVGVTTVTCTALDTHANAATATFKVTVTDTTPPTVTVPATMTVSPTSAAGAAVTYTATATDNFDVAVTATCTPPSSSTFPVGTTTVRCTATDKAGNTGSASFSVLVKPYITSPPVITVPPDRTVGADSAAGVLVTYPASATDALDGTDPVTCTPPSGSTFPVGITTVTCTAMDSAGRSARKSFAITVDPMVVPTTAKVSSARAGAGGIATVVLSCQGPTTGSCEVTIALRTSKKTTAGVIATRDVSLAGGRRKTERLHLSRFQALKLARLHRLTVYLELTQAAGDGTPTTTTRRLVFVSPAAKKK